jgi:hypothetical protein
VLGFFARARHSARSRRGGGLGRLARRRRCARIIDKRKEQSEMSATDGFLAAFAIITLGGVGLAGFLLWLRNRDAQSEGH